jgi:hypothetical protein
MILNRKILLVLLLAGPTIFGQSKSDEWHLFADSRAIFCVAMANGQIGIVTDDTPLKTKEIILNVVSMTEAQRTELVGLLEESRE